MRIRNRLFLAIVSLTIAVFLGSQTAFALALHDVPGAVRRTIEKEAKGGKVLDVGKEGDGKTATYSAVVETGGKSYDIVVNAQGKLLSKKLVSEKINTKEKAKSGKGQTEKDGKKSDGGKKGGSGGTSGSDGGWKTSSAPKSK